MPACQVCKTEFDVNEQPVIVTYPCGDKFHWECVLPEEEDTMGPAEKCLGCGESVVQNNQLLVSIEYTEDGHIDTDYDLLPTLREELDPSQRAKTALWDACFIGNEALAVQLVQQDSGLVHAVDEEKGWTALFYATVAGRKDLVQFLLNNGADPSHADSAGNQPLVYAIEERYQDLIPLLRLSS